MAACRRAAMPAWLLAALVASPAWADPLFVDSGGDAAAWKALSSPSTSISLRQDGPALRADFDLGRGRGHVLLHRDLSLDLPSDYMFVVHVRGTGEPNTIEFKVISGENVWWRRFPDHTPTEKGQDLRISKSRLEFAWGPAGGGLPAHVDAIEIAVVAGKGGHGTLWVDQLRVDPRQGSDPTRPPSIVASAASGTGTDFLLDSRADTSWVSPAGDKEPSLLLDFHDAYEHGGFILDQDDKDYAVSYVVEASPDAKAWTEVARLTSSNGGRDYLYLPDVFARYIRFRFLKSSRGRGIVVRELKVQPFEFSSSPNHFFAGIAADAAPGLYPRYFSGEQSYWTVVGLPGGNDEALLNEEGMLEVAAGSFSVEPFLWTGGRLLGWKQGRHTPSLEDDELPIPSVLRQHDGVSLAVTAFADAAKDGAALYARYRVTNTGVSPLAGKLFLALRPFQVLPPWQMLNMTGGATRTRSIGAGKAAAGTKDEVRVDDRRIVAVTPWSGFGAAAFEQGDVSSFLAAGALPPPLHAEDAFGYASGALAYDLELAPGEVRDVWIAVPWDISGDVAGDARGRRFPAAATASDAEKRFDAARDQWRRIVARVGISLPPAAADLVHSARSNLAYILINRDGAAIQPGSRTYARSWIRDGALTSASLLELGFDDEARDFLRWYAGFQREDGWVPCCVDARGADPVPEHDSFGEFIWGVAEVYRHTGDTAFVRELWPHVASAAACMKRLRATNMTPQYREPSRIAFFGLLPESISHEGYSSRPVHSYWDDVFALRGFTDAAMLAGVVGDRQREAEFGADRDSFRTTLEASVAVTREANHLDTIPASAELADFDPTSTAIAFVLGLEDVYPAAPLRATFEKYLANVRGRAGGSTRGVGYTAYEMRNVPALTLLGLRSEALATLASMVADQRPAAWNQWPEISWLEPTEPSFLGDLPHTWIGSTFLHATRTLLVHERSRDASLVLGTGVPLAWLGSGKSDDVIEARSLSTHYGDLSFRMRRGKDGTVVVAIDAGISIPPGAVLVAAPFGETVTTASVDGREAPLVQGEVRVDKLPATVEFRYTEAASRP